MRLSKFLVTFVLILITSCITLADSQKENETISGPKQTMEMCMEQHGEDYSAVVLCYRTQEKAAEAFFEEYYIPTVEKYEDEESDIIKPEAKEDKKVQILYGCSKSWKDYKGRQDWVMLLMCVEKLFNRYEKYVSNHTM